MSELDFLAQRAATCADYAGIGVVADYLEERHDPRGERLRRHLRRREQLRPLVEHGLNRHGRAYPDDLLREEDDRLFNDTVKRLAAGNYRVSNTVLIADSVVSMTGRRVAMWRRCVVLSLLQASSIACRPMRADLLRIACAGDRHPEPSLRLAAFAIGVLDIHNRSSHTFLCGIARLFSSLVPRYSASWVRLVMCGAINRVLDLDKLCE